MADKNGVCSPTSLNNKIILVLFSIITTAVLSVCGWMFSEIRDLPEARADFITKEELNVCIDDTERRFNTIINIQNKRLENIEDGVNEINTFLRDYFSEHNQ